MRELKWVADTIGAGSTPPARRSIRDPGLLASSRARSRGLHCGRPCSGLARRARGLEPLAAQDAPPRAVSASGSEDHRCSCHRRRFGATAGAVARWHADRYQQSRSQSRIGLMLQRLDQLIRCRCPGQPMPGSFLLAGRQMGRLLRPELRGAAEDCRRGRKPGNHLQGRDSSQPVRAGQPMRRWCSQPVWNPRASKQARA